jgi:hypothetical protein
MLYEMRTYTLQPGTAGAFVDLYNNEVLPVITSHLTLAGFWTTEFGKLNTVVSLWKYDSLDDRARRRKELAADPKWTPMVQKMLPLLVEQENSVLVPSPFSPLS